VLCEESYLRLNA